MSLHSADDAPVVKVLALRPGLLPSIPAREVKQAGGRVGIDQVRAPADHGRLAPEILVLPRQDRQHSTRQFETCGSCAV